ncbi:MAG: hypothetical protein KDE22_15080 [Rhodobacterales bacterium]|nr:hypothetical protein [Rhodobacterales bacterium]
MAADLTVKSAAYWPIRVPLAEPYHLSAVYGTLTHSQAVILRLELADGTVGWGEADPGGKKFDGYTLESTCQALDGLLPGLIGQDVADWVDQKRGRARTGAAAAAMDVACHDALGRATGRPVWQLLGTRRRPAVESLWPTSSGTAEQDMATINRAHAQGYRTYMLKMGDRPIDDEIVRTRAVLDALPAGTQLMVDANQGWTREQAQAYVAACDTLPLVLVEQPLPADDLEGLKDLRTRTRLPISVDEAILRPDQVADIIAADAADVFSIKISKNGGLANSQAIADMVEAAGKRILMNSMIELGITQAASLHLGCTIAGLVPCGHAYMSTRRMADDIADFSDWVYDGAAHLPDGEPGLGVKVSLDKIEQYCVGERHGF